MKNLNCSITQMAPGKSPARARVKKGFTLVELLVVIAIIAILAGLLLPVLARAKQKAIRTQCLSNVHQIEIALAFYGSQFNDKVPWLGTDSSGNPIGAWCWDIPAQACNVLLQSGLTKKSLYCPSTAPRFTDQQNWAGPGPTLWDFGDPLFHIVGYAFAFGGPSSKLQSTNQNTTLQGENALLPDGSIFAYYSPSERVLVADVQISNGQTQPGYNHPANDYTDVAGGYQLHHLSAHLEGGNVPAGGFKGYKDGHAEWDVFQDSVPRTVGGPYFWW